MEGFWKEIKIHFMNTYIIIFKQNVADKFARLGVNDNYPLCYRLDLIQYDCHSSTQPQHELELDFIMARNPPHPTTGTFKALPGNLGS